MTPPPQSPTELRKQRLDAEYAQLSAQHEAAAHQLRTTLNAADKPALQAQVDRLEMQLDAKWNEIEALAHGGPARTVAGRQQQWEDSLPQIDFKDAWLAFEAVYTQHIHCETGGAAIIVAPDSETMCAELFVRRLASWLRKKPNSETANFRHEQFEILSHNELTPGTFVSCLGSYFDAPPIAEPDALARLADKMVGGLTAGGVLFVEARIFHDLFAQGAFMTWLLERFWPALTASVTRAARERAFVKCILFLSIDQPLPATHATDARFCPLCDYRPPQPRLAHLPLTPWSEADIKAWLVDYSGQPEWSRQPKLDEMTRAIFGSSRNGQPDRALKRIKDLLSQSWTA